ncbi:hypothetical protein SELMODRAFT_410825 [Selaginella moellendorffii]|uniref:Uncharacterized protein n=1 Tax=Selaginella moellendorffii TaxID=88036 RepID=D8RFZ7_SELML|nr:hypothetical protein SELMODRAFT_410825 [Selaginella moellendorffii]
MWRKWSALSSLWGFITCKGERLRVRLNRSIGGSTSTEISVWERLLASKTWGVAASLQAKITSLNFQAFISRGSAKDLYLRCMYLLPICLGIGDKDLASVLMECWGEHSLDTVHVYSQTKYYRFLCITRLMVENLLVHTILEGLEVRHIKRMNKFNARDSKDVDSVGEVVALEKFKCSSFKLHFEASAFTTALEQHHLKDRKKAKKKVKASTDKPASIATVKMSADSVLEPKTVPESERNSKIIGEMWSLPFGQRLWRDEDLLGAYSVDRFIVLNDASKHDTDRYSLTPSVWGGEETCDEFSFKTEHIRVVPPARESAACSLLGTSQGTSSSDLLRSSALDLYWHRQSLLLNGNSSLGISTSLFPDSLDDFAQQTPGVLLSPNDIQMVEVDRQ